MEVIISKIVENSILGAVLAVFLWFTWRGGKWLGTEILIPMKNRAILHIDRLDRATSHMETTVDRIEGAITSQNRVLQVAAESNEDQTNKIDRIDKNVRTLREDAAKFFGQQDREYQDRHPGEYDAEGDH
jgi:hypothetical protein